MSALDDLYINKPEIRISLKYASPIGVCEKSGVIKNVVSVVLPEDMTDLVKYAFANFTALKSVVLPEGLEYISKGAFMNCTALEQITIPKNVILNVHFFISLSLEKMSTQIYLNAIRPAQHKEQRYALHTSSTIHKGILSM